MSGRHRSGSKRVPPEIGLHMECVEEELEPSQVAYYEKAEKEFKEVEAKLEGYVKKMKAEIIEKGENCLVLQMNATPAPASTPPTQVSAVPTGGKVKIQQSIQQNFQQVVGPGILTRSTTNTGGNTYLMMDPRLGLVVGQVAQSTAPEPNSAPASSPKQVTATRPRPTTTSAPPALVATRSRSSKKGSLSESEAVQSAPITRTRDKTKNQTSPQTSPTTVTPCQTILPQQVFSPATPTTTSSGTYRIKTNAKQLPPPAKPTENNALGGLSAGSKTPWKPNADEAASGKANLADSKEVTFNKLSGKTFPSLVVIARPHLRLKYIPQSNITQERTALDAKVKGVLMYTPTKFTEWLIQQGLIKSEQICQTHVNNDLSPVKLKLGMYSDVSKFPYSGGYVWISECCPSQFVSVFSGSVFEGAPHPPTTLLKLIYHWACQTNVQNVVQWVKVDNFYVKNFFTNMRAVCTQAVHQKYQKIGGPRKKVEVGVISLGTTSQDGNMRQVKVEVLGVMDAESKMIRLRAVEPLSDERNFKRRFVKILEPLEEWVHKESAILTDFTVDKGTLNNMGFHTVYQVSITDPPSKYSNQNVMEYLRRIVPRMFQNTLSLLSRQIIQQFLDELVWREMWGPIASQAFVNIIAHMAEQTKLDVVDSLLSRLTKVASNPFKVWNYSAWKPVTTSLSNTKVQSSLPATTSAAPITTSTTALENVPLVNRLASAETSSSLPLPPTTLKIRTRKRLTEQSETEISPVAKKAAKVAFKEKPKKDEKLKTLEKPVKKEKEKEKDKDNGEKLPDEVLAFINNEENKIPVGSYYYGTRSGEAQTPSFEYKGKFSVKCVVCNKRFTDNIVLMKHMILHCQSEPMLTIDLKNVFQCSYCFLGYNTYIALKTHLEEVHSVVHNKIERNFDCLICETKFKDKTDLIYHMHRTHVEMELPYECGVCQFRTSVYKNLTDHFIQNHKGGEHIFCPFCLKVVSLAHKGKVISANSAFYLSHLEKHHRKTLVKNCHRCQLSFIHKGILEQHLEADHCSFKYEYGVKPFTNCSEAILMPEPGSVIKPAPLPKSGRPPGRTKSTYLTNIKFKGLEINGIEHDMSCAECEGTLSRPEHFTGSYNCLKCRYATCCEKAMAEHVCIFHDSQVPQFTMGKPIVLPEEMFCVCSYASRSGNRLAKHIAICERKSAYPNEEAASAAVRKSERSKLEEKNNQSGEPQNMLNMLGLMRKSPETSAVTEAAKKEATVDNQEDVAEVAIKQEQLNLDQQSTEAEEEVQSGFSKVISEEENKCSSTTNEDAAMDIDTDPTIDVEMSEQESSPPAGNPLTELMDVDDEPALDSHQEADSASDKPVVSSLEVSDDHTETSENTNVDISTAEEEPVSSTETKADEEQAEESDGEVDVEIGRSDPKQSQLQSDTGGHEDEKEDPPQKTDADEVQTEDHKEAPDVFQSVQKSLSSEQDAQGIIDVDEEESKVQTDVKEREVDLDESVAESACSEAEENEVGATCVEDPKHPEPPETPTIDSNLENLRNEEIESQENTVDENRINENIENSQIQNADRSEPDFTSDDFDFGV